MTTVTISTENKEPMLKNIASLLSALAFIGLVVIMYLVGTQYLANQARHDCAQDYQLSFNDTATNTQISQPVEDLYKKCLTEKGL